MFRCPRARLRLWSRETGSAVPSRVSLLISILRLNLVLTYGIPPEFRGGVHLCVTPSGTFNELDVQNEWEENTHTVYKKKALQQYLYKYSISTRTSCLRVRQHQQTGPAILHQYVVVQGAQQCFCTRTRAWDGS